MHKVRAVTGPVLTSMFATLEFWWRPPWDTKRLPLFPYYWSRLKQSYYWTKPNYGHNKNIFYNIHQEIMKSK